MKSWAQPTADEIERVAVLSARPENRAYFFDRLDNPLWVVPLANKGFFSEPPEPIVDTDSGSVLFPPWPEGRYLSRMAVVAPVEVVTVLTKIHTSKNPAVTQLLFQAAASLPIPQLKDLSDRIRSWVNAPHAEYFAEDAAIVAKRLLEGDPASALDIIESLLAVQPDPRLAEKTAFGDAPMRPTPEASARFSEWEYERIIEIVLAPAIEIAGLRTLRLFAKLLEDAVRLSSWQDESSADDISYSWRPAVEDHTQNWNTGIKDTLVSTLRDASLLIASQGESEAKEVVRELQSRSTIHRRIGLHVLANTEFASEIVAEQLGDKALFEDHRMRHEYANLLRSRFQEADTALQEQILSWIEDGPDLDEYRRIRREIDHEEPSEDQAQRYADLWRRDRYSFLEPHLEGRSAARFRELVGALGEPEHPDFVSWSSSWTGPESPIDKSELLHRSTEDVLQYLREWQPNEDSGWGFGPSMEGLGRVMAGVIAARPDDYARVAERFREEDPTYIRALFSGLGEALKENKTFSWDEPITLADWVVHQEFEPDDETLDRGRDPGWRWCRREISSTIRSGLSDKPNRIPFELRDRIWAIIERLTEDPNPSPQHEERYGGENMDPLTLSLNTNRGAAMHTVIEYALWCRRELDSSEQDVSAGFDLMPEVAQVLEIHLDRNLEPSLAIRAVFGRWLPWLLLIDENWTNEHLSLIFPDDPEADAFWWTAWSTYIVWCPPYDSVFRSLRKEYQEAVRRVPSGKKGGTFGNTSPDSKLGEHLVTFYWRGLGELDILEEFFANAEDELAAQVFEFIGRALRNTSGEVSTSVLERIQSLWGWRAAVGETDPERHREELRAFGSLFASGKLDEVWTLSALAKSVDLVGSPALGHLVTEKLADIANREPVASVRILARMIERPTREWDYLGWREHAKAVVTAAITSGDADAVERAKDIVDSFVRRGQLEFRELLPRNN